MSGYHTDPSKITFDRADVLVERYLRSRSEHKTRVTCKDIAREFDVKESHHNLIRLTEALSDKLEPVDNSSSKATQFKVDNETTVGEGN